MVGQAAIGLAAFLTTSAAFAASFAVDPLRLTFSDQPVQALFIRNTSVEPLVLQLDLLDWSQEHGEEIFEPTEDLLVSPPITTIPAGGTQIVRIGLRKPPDPQEELSYRLFLQEVPKPRPDFEGLQVAVRISLPVFIQPTTTAMPELSWRLEPIGERKVRVIATNGGNAHEKITGFTLRSGATVLATNQIQAYLLPGQEKIWSFDLDLTPEQGARLHLTAETSGGDKSVELIVEGF
jgi:fimbrial chaperone protein